MELFVFSPVNLLGTVTLLVEDSCDFFTPTDKLPGFGEFNHCGMGGEWGPPEGCSEDPNSVFPLVLVVGWKLIACP